jgi:hypothetical protein
MLQIYVSNISPMFTSGRAMRQRKGVVPVIATMLLLIITSATVLVLYSYVSGTTVLPDSDQQAGKMLEKLKTVEVKGYADGHYSVFIMNTGDINSTIDTFYVKDFTGNTLVAVPVNVPIAVGETKEFVFDPYLVGQSPWAWYEVVGVTNRANKVTTNLYGYITGASELGEAPSANEYDYAYNVFNVTIDNIPTASANLPNLTAIDGNYYSFLAENWTNSFVSFPTSALEYDINSGIYHTKSDVSNLNDLSGEPYVLLYNVKTNGSNCFASGIFSGNTANNKYPQIMLTFIFDVQGSVWDQLTGTIQFYDWSSNEYVTSGNGFYTLNGSTLPYAVPPAQSGFKNFTVILDASALIGENGEWRVLVNITTSNPTTIKLDYFTVKEWVDSPHMFETIFWYQANNVIDENNVTNVLFSMTGIFPSSSSYWFMVWNFDKNGWYALGQFQGTSDVQTVIFQIDWPCSSYIQNGTKNVEVKVLPTQPLPSSELIRIDQTRLIIRQIEFN